MGKLLEELRSRKAEIEALAVNCGVFNIRIFGSVVRGEDDEESDIDLLIDMKPEARLMDYLRFKVRTEEMFARPVDVVQEKTLRTRMRPRVLQEAQPL